MIATTLICLTLLACATFGTDANGGREKWVEARADKAEKMVMNDGMANEKETNQRAAVRRKLTFDVPTATREGKLFYVVSRSTSSPGKNQFYNKTWTQYREGFGRLNSDNYWLGLRKMTQLTIGGKTARFELRVRDDDESKGKICVTNYCRHTRLAWAIYHNFRILDESHSYQLEAGEYDSLESTATDGLIHRYGGQRTRIHSGMQFSTWDRDNDMGANFNCAAAWGCGWWWNACSQTVTTRRAADGRMYWARGRVTHAGLFIQAN